MKDMIKYKSHVATTTCAGVKSIISSCIWLSALSHVFAERNINCNGTLLNTKWGPICGKRDRSNNGREIVAYLGIPYALPPVGDLRFKNPQRWNRLWNYILDATTKKSSCLNITYDTSHNEDCLYLNVYMPWVSETRQTNLNRPVLVLVQGDEPYVDANESGKLYNPKYLMDRDVILVTLNYRLHILGFISSANNASPENNGLKDIVTALQWVQGNINFFHGNPRSVTLMGTSISSSAVHLLALTNKTEGLFHKYILISGSAFSPSNMRQYDARKYRLICGAAAQRAGCLPDAIKFDSIIRNFDKDRRRNKTENIYNIRTPTKGAHAWECYDRIMMNCMRKVDLWKLYITAKSTRPTCGPQENIFGPTIEPESEDAILTMHPLKILTEGLFRDIPVLMITMDEKALSVLTHDFVLHQKYLKDGWNEKLIGHFEQYLPYFIGYNEIINDTHKFADEIKNFYFNGNLNENLMKNFTKMMGDAITWPMIEALQYHSKMGNSGNYHIQMMEKKYGLAGNILPMNHLINETNESDTVNSVIGFLETFMTKRLVTSGRTWPKYFYNGEVLETGYTTNITTQTEFLMATMNFWSNLILNVSDQLYAPLYHKLLQGY